MKANRIDRLALARELKEEPQQIEPLSQGLFPLYQARLKDRRIAIKVLPPEQARVEFRDLAALEAHGYRVPGGRSLVRGGSQDFLVMELIAALPTGNKKAVSPALMEDLKRIYSNRYDHWGYAHPNYIGRLAQPNAITADFFSFYWEYRFHPQLLLAMKQGLLLESDGDAARQRLEEVGHILSGQRSVFLHGDLWAGNVLLGQDAYFIDPAVAYGHPEQDLAMLALFGGPLGTSELAQIAKDTGSPEGFLRRLPFWQIYPLLVHVNLFGLSYVRQLRAALAERPF